MKNERFDSIINKKWESRKNVMGGKKLSYSQMPSPSKNTCTVLARLVISSHISWVIEQKSGWKCLCFWTGHILNCTFPPSGIISKSTWRSWKLCTYKLWATVWKDEWMFESSSKRTGFFTNHIITLNHDTVSSQAEHGHK